MRNFNQTPRRMPQADAEKTGSFRPRLLILARSCRAWFAPRPFSRHPPLKGRISEALKVRAMITCAMTYIRT